jgi:hypothetical protein
VLRYHDFSRFGLATGAEAIHFAAFSNGMEGVLAPDDRRLAR